MSFMGCGQRTVEPSEAGRGSGAAGAGFGEDATVAGGSQGGLDAGAIPAWSGVASGTDQDLERVWGSAPNDVWAVGAGGTILHWNGSAWSGVASGTTVNLYGVWGSGLGNVWAVGAGGMILHFDGSSWSAAMGAPSLPISFYGVWGSGPSDVWTVGDGGTILHWNGSTWSRTDSALPSGTPQALYSVWGTGASGVWAVGFPPCVSTGSATDCLWGDTLYWNGSTWSVAAKGRRLADLWASGPGDVWAVGVGALFASGAILHSDGSAWTVAVTRFGSGNWNGTWGSGPGDVWAVGGDIVHWDGSEWSVVIQSPPSWLTCVWGSGPDDVWAVGYAGTILHR